MNDNGNRYALHALRERRAALDGELRQCEQRLRHFANCFATWTRR